VGLNPGDEYRLSFYSSVARDAVSGNIAEYNQFVTDLALAVPELAALGTSWNALASTSSIDARDNTSTNPIANGAGEPIYLLDGNLLASDYGDLWDGSIQSPLSITETGAAHGIYTVWTGSSDDGTARLGFEIGGSPPVSFGSPGEVSGGWMFIGTSSAAHPELHFYAVSGVLTAVPEPSTALLLGLGLAGMAARRRPRR